MNCEECGTTHKRKRFCCNKCKDRWWNKQPHRASRTEVFSGKTVKEWSPDDDVHPFSQDAFNHG
jgi:hypothetical protein